MKMNQVRKDLPPLPMRIRSLPIDARGFPVPKFVAKIDGEYDFRVVEPAFLFRAMHFDLCWLCGQKLGVKKVFVAGPMCVVNRTSGEPPCHHDCALFAVKTCPFMLRPNMKRNEHDLPGNTSFHEMGIARNPGVYAMYTTTHYKWHDGPKVITMGAPLAVEWFAHGRKATRAEVVAAIDAGLPLLREIAVKAGQEKELNIMHAAALALLPL